MDRDLLIERTAHIPRAPSAEKEVYASRMVEAERLILITMPQDKEEFRPDFFNRQNMPVGREILDGLLVPTNSEIR